MLERGRIGESARPLEGFCLVTPNWSMQLPDQPYDGDDPDAFDPRDDIVGFLERYARTFDVPVRDGVDVRSCERPMEAASCSTRRSGPWRRVSSCSPPAHSAPAELLLGSEVPADLLQLDTTGYVSPTELPDGPVLIVGSGQSGCQIVEELAEAGRDVFLSCGRRRGCRGGSATTTSPGG